MTCAGCGHENPDGSRFCSGCGAELVTPDESSREARKTVTVLFCDLAGYTSMGDTLDPEALRKLQSRYFQQARAALERHGGTVEKFIGDAVMAVFGVPHVHEDDSLRAVRAAVELRDAVERLGLRARIGVNTGEVVAGGGDASVTGDAVNVAARLEQAAAPGEILLGEPTLQLVRAAVEAEVVEPLALKGKAETVPAHRLLRVYAGRSGVARHFDSPLVGRRAELVQLRTWLDGAVAERRCKLVTVVGAPGIGKSRLAQEFTAGLDEASVLSGRCLPYGDGITYWPLLEIFRDAGAEDEIVSALSAGVPEDVVWAVRKSFERRAREQPLVLVVEDIHWAEEPFLDLLEHLADWTRDAPLLVLCLARPELLDQRPAWGGSANIEPLVLEPLADEETEALIDARAIGAPLDDATRARVHAGAGGNPLFVEQLVARVAEGGDPAEAPPSIQALLGARVDGLPQEQRELLERASVVGLEFDWDMLAALGADRRRPSGAVLAALVRKELIAPHERTADAFRFRHMLIRDAAYDRIPKERRALVHERFGDYLETADAVPERDELAGYHLEQAYRYRVELDEADATAERMATRAAAHLGAAGSRAFGRSDISAAVGLLSRARELMGPGDPGRARLLIDLGSALGEAGLFEEAHAALGEALSQAGVAQDRIAEGRAKLEQVFLRMDEPGFIEEGERTAQELEPLFAQVGDHQALARLWRLAGMVALFRSRNGEMASAMERALDHARRAGDGREEGLALFWIPTAVVFGPMPVEAGIRRCKALLESVAGRTVAEAGVRHGLGMLYAMHGRAEEARAALRQSRAVYRELGLDVLGGAATMDEAMSELWLGDPGAAELACREAMGVFERLGERGYNSTAAAVLAEALNRLGRHDEAEEPTRLSEQLASPDDMPSQVGWRRERARALARRGELEEAERLAREAVALSEPTDSLDGKGECALALAEILGLAGRDEEAADSAAAALDAWERKGIVNDVERARALLAGVQVPT